MKRKNKCSSRGVATLGVVTAAALAVLPASAQTTYNWLGDGAGGTNASWTDPTPYWEDLTAPANPAANPPGSLVGGAADDIVIVTNTRVSAQEQVRIDNVDVGTIAELRIGGGPNIAQVSVRGNNGNVDIGTLTLGAGGAGGDAGQFLLNNVGSSATVGTVVSGSNSNGNRIIIGNNANGGLTLNGDIDAAGTREIDFRIQTNDDVNTTRVVLGTGGQLLSVDDFIVGNTFNSNNTGSFTLDAANVVEANNIRVGNNAGSTSNGAARTVTGTLTIDGGASATSLGGNGQNGNIIIGFADANYSQDQTATGTINVGDGTLAAPNLLELGRGTLNGNATGVVTADGTLNLNDANSVVNVGRINDVNSQIAGGLTVGTGRQGSGEVNINAGTLSSIGRVYIAGDATDGLDRDTTGTINVNAGGTLEVGNVTASDLTFNGNARAADTVLGTSNLEVGRDGAGTLNVDGGTLTLYRGNLVLGQNGNDTVDEFNQPSVASNISRGTVNFTNGAQVTIGVTQGAELTTDSTPGPPVTSEVLSSLNFNNGGGDITQSGAGTSVTIEQNLVMTNAANENSYTISGGSLDVGNNLSAQNNQLNILGDGATILVQSDLTTNGNTNLTFDFLGGSLITDIDVGGDVDLNANGANGAELFLLNTSALGTYTADIALIDLVGGGSIDGVFRNFAEGDTVAGTAYKLTYNFTGGGIGLINIPEPSTLATLGLGLALLIGRRRRS